jgi:hypothetical protein
MKQQAIFIGVLTFVGLIMVVIASPRIGAQEAGKIDPIITTHLATLTFGEPQVFRNMAVIPLFASGDEGPDYITLKEALDNKVLRITEVNKGGSVPELKATNTSDRFILMLDGEQLVGAKQNRILNTPILLKGKSAVIIPVSCTEQGRWTDTSNGFADGGTMMSNRMRADNYQSVSKSLKAGRKHQSDQSRIWSLVEGIQQKAGIRSSTSALQDVYTSKQADFDQFIRAFPSVPQQQGMMVFINGEVAGFDLISRASAYKILHPKLILSYAMDAMLQPTAAKRTPSLDDAKAFVEEIKTCRESRFPSVDQGYDYRFEGDHIAGSALVFEKSVVHLAFFRISEQTKIDPMSSFNQRRDFRRDTR